MKQGLLTAFLIFSIIQLSPIAFGQQTNRDSASDNLRSDTIDVTKYTIDMDFTDMSSQTISASCKVKFTSEMDNIEGITLDLLAFTIDSIQRNGADLTYNYDDTLLRVETPNTLNTGDEDSLTVYYHGTPQQDPSGFGGFYFQGDYAYNLGVAFEANPHTYGRTWHPCFDNFVERASYDITVTSPAGKTAYSNGYIESESTGPNNENIRRWILEEEIPSYLACVGVAPYTHVAQTYTSTLTNDQTPVMLIAKQQDTTNMKNSFANLFGAMEAFETGYGPYRWNKIGFALVPFNGGAMEHATCIMYPKATANGGLQYETLMAHELSHHWWGDLVTCRTAEDMWINEGLASYSESIFLEHVYDHERYLDEIKGTHRDVLQKAAFNDGAFYSLSGVPHDATYGDHTYNKGATMIHNLRTYMGEVDFFDGLRAIQNNYAFKTINATEFRDELMNETGDDLTAFFDNYVFQPGFNGFEIDSVEVVGSAPSFDVTVHIQQKLYEAPSLYTDVPMEITFVDQDRNEYSTTEIVSGAQSEITVIVPFQPKMVYLNKNSALLNAVTGENLTTADTPIKDFNYAYFRISVDQNTDTSLIRVEHHRVAPDPIEDAYIEHQFAISPDRYWKVDGILSSDFESKARIFFDGRNAASGNLDVGLMTDHGGVTFTEDSLVLLWRSNQKSRWEEYPFYDLETQGSDTDGYGRMEVNQLLKGEYAFGFRKNIASLSEENNTKRIEIFPNPVRDELKVRIPTLEKNYSLKVYDTNGRLLYNDIMREIVHRISTEYYSKGSYYIMIFDEHQLIEKYEFIKE